jgi:tRNA-modifying protein YgfZ
MTQSLRAAVLPDRSVVAIGGPDRIKFLQGLTTNDVRRLAPDRALYAGFLTGQGKLLCDVFLIEDGDRVLIDIASSLADDFVKRLTAFKLRAAVDIGKTVPGLAVAALWGMAAAARLTLEATEGTVGHGAFARPHHVFVDPRIAALGARLVYPADVAIKAEFDRLGFVSATPSDYAVHRLALGIADTAEIAGETCYALEANFEPLHGVDFRKGCYIGQELTARMKLKVGLRKRILPVSGATALPAAGTLVTADATKLGPLIATSGAHGLALLRLDYLAGAKTDAIRADGIQLSVHWPSWLPLGP